jgi:methionine-R-sulfoxide reductase
MPRPTLALLIALHALALSPAVFAGCTPSVSADASPLHGSAAAETPAPHPSSKVYVRPPTAELQSRLTPTEFDVTQNAGTEPPFHNAYWDNHAPGLYVDVVTGEPLFSSQDKFESGTGWPSFTRPVDDGHVIEHRDVTLMMERTEVVSKGGRSHLGHVFDDGPAPTGKRFCINSASLRFIPADRLATEGYSDYASRFGVAAPAGSGAEALRPDEGASRR